MHEILLQCGDEIRSIYWEKGDCTTRGCAGQSFKLLFEWVAYLEIDVFPARRQLDSQFANPIWQVSMQELVFQYTTRRCCGSWHHSKCCWSQTGSLII